MIIQRLQHEIDGFTGIVVNYNTPDLAAQAVDSLFNYGASQVIVVDNGEQKYQDNTHQSVQLIDAGRNLGFGQAVNLAVQSATQKVLVFLNSDATLQPGAFDAITSVATGHAALMGGAETSPSRLEPFCPARPDYTWVGECLRAILGDRLAERIAKFPAISHGPTVNGAFMVTQRHLFDIIGGFNSRYFMYLEDTELSHRYLAAGLPVQNCPNVCIEHAGQASSSSSTKLQLESESLAIYYNERFGLSRAKILVLLRRAMAWLKYTIRRTPKTRYHLEMIGHTWQHLNQLLPPSP